MAKNITYFDREHTGGINLAAMEDTQLKENLVQDIAVGGEEAPTATAVKEAVDAKMDRADIINDLTTGGADKALSAEQGKVLEGKKVDKLMDATDLVYVHGSDGTEQGKPLAEFVVDTDIVDDLTTGGVDKALSAEQGKVLEGKKVDKVVIPDSVYVTEGSKPLEDFAMKADTVSYKKVELTDGSKTLESMPSLLELSNASYSQSIFYIDPADLPADVKVGDILLVDNARGTAKEVRSVSCVVVELSHSGGHSVISNDVLNSKLPAGMSNWNGFVTTFVLASGYEREVASLKAKTHIVTLHDGDTLNTMPSISDTITGGYSESSLYVKEQELFDYYTERPLSNSIRIGDIIVLIPSRNASKRTYTCMGIVIGRSAASNTQLSTDVLNTSLPASGTWEGYTELRLMSSGYDRAAMLNNADSTKMQFYSVPLSKTGKTFASMPNLTDYNKDKGMSHSVLFVHPDDLGDVKANLKKGDFVSFPTVTNSDGKKMGHLNTVFNLVEAGTTPNDERVINETTPEEGSFNGWYYFSILSSAYDRVQIVNKLNHYKTELQSTGKTWPTIPNAGSNITSGLLGGIVFIHPDDIPDIADKIKEGDTLNCVTTNKDSTGKYLSNMVLKYYRVGTATDKLSPNILNNALPAEGSFEGWLLFYKLSSGYDRVNIQRFYRITFNLEDGICLGLRPGYYNIIKPNAALSDLLPNLKYGDIVELSDSAGHYVYTYKFIMLCEAGDNTNGNRDFYVVGQDTIPNDITGWPMFEMISAFQSISNRSVTLITNRYQASQFTVGNTYHIRYKVQGNDRLSIPGTSSYIEASHRQRNKLAITEALLSGASLKLILDNESMFVILHLSAVWTTEEDFIGECIAKGSTNIVRL